MKHRKLLTIALSIFLIIALVVPATAERFQRLTVSELVVTKSARIDGLLQAAANTTGNVWYVDSGSGIDGVGAPGTSSATPFATLDYAIGRCTANNGDFIIVMPGHAETISAADGFDADVAGITILGLGSGTDMPEFTFTATDSTVAIGAANVRIFNLRFIAGVSAIVDGISVEAAGDSFELAYCEFPEPTTSSFEFVTAINLGSTADWANFHHNIYYNADATGGSHWIEMGDGVNVGTHITDNLVFGEFLVAGIWSDTADPETLIARNNITNLTTGQYAIEFTGAATGSVIDNLLRTDTQAIALDPGSMSMVGNLWDDEDTADSVAIPVIAAASGADTIGAINDATTDSLHGKIGTDTEMADSSLYDMLGSNVATTTDSINGKIGTDTEMADSSLYDMLTAAAFGTLNATTTDTLHGKIGTDTEMGDASLYDMWVLDQVDLDAILADTITISGGTLPAAPVSGSLATFISGGSVGLGQPLPASTSLVDIVGNFTGPYNGAAQDDNVKASLDLAHTDLDAILADTDSISGIALPAAPVANSLAAFVASGGTALGTELADSKSIVDALGTDGTTPIDAATSVLGAIGVNDADNVMDTSSVVTNDDGSVFERLEGILDQAEKAVTTSTAVMVNGNTIFTIAGGPIKIVDLVSVCITDNNATASTLQYSADPTVGAATTFSGASASLANFAAGGAVVLNQTALATAPDLSTVLVALGSVATNKIIINEGIITVVIGVGSTTGTWKHYLRYVPLAPGVTVTGT